MLSLLTSIFTWWNGATLGTRWTVWRSGKFVGEDELGNKYYEEPKARPGLWRRRWVLYNGLAEASKVPAEWHGWLHHTVKQAPTETDYQAKSWQTGHQPNYTGTDRAYHPKGSLAGDAVRAPATGDYKAWQPDA